jgi:hypothetical protein
VAADAVDLHGFSVENETALRASQAG